MWKREGRREVSDVTKALDKGVARGAFTGSFKLKTDEAVEQEYLPATHPPLETRERAFRLSYLLVTYTVYSLKLPK